MSRQNGSPTNPNIPRGENPTSIGRKIRVLMTYWGPTLRNDGPGALLREIRKMALFQLHTKVFDKLLLGTEPPSVSEVTQLDDLTIDSKYRADGAEYQPTPLLLIGWIHRLLPKDVANWSFIDVGAGRGRVVKAAASYPYRRVLGIEFAINLQQDARRNIASIPAEKRLAGEVDVIHASATNFQIPDGPCIFYLFNPFAAPVLRKFLENVIASHRQHPRQMRIAYYHPVHASVMAEYPQIGKCRIPLMTRMKFAALSPYEFELYRPTSPPSLKL